jgi:hypothetical protein
MENSAHSVTKSIILYVCTARTPNVEILRDSIKIPVLITCTKEPSEYWTPSSIKNTFLVFYIYFFLLKILVSKRETGGNGSIRLQLGTMLCIFMYCRRFWPKRFVKMSIFLKTNVSIMLLCKLLFFGVEVAVFSTSFFWQKWFQNPFMAPGRHLETCGPSLLPRWGSKVRGVGEANGAPPFVHLHEQNLKVKQEKGAEVSPDTGASTSTLRKLISVLYCSTATVLYVHTST